MAKVLCAISGIEFKTDYFQIYLTSREYYHPIFTLTTPELLKLADSYLENKFSPTENYLYYLALFNSTELIEFRVPAVQTQHTQSIIAQNITRLLCMVEKIHYSGEDKVLNVLNLPKYVISPDTKDLSSSKDWVSIWEQNYADYLNSYKTSTALEKLNRKEFLLERLIKDKTKEISSYSAQLAEWAALAGEFDTHANYIVLDEQNKNILMKDYWKRIIRMCANGQAIFEVPEVDMIDLIEHCEEIIDHGSIFSHTLMALLRSSLKKKQSFLSLGDVDIGEFGTVFKILRPEDSVEDANKIALIDSAPVSEPKAQDYPNKLAYLKARTKWEMAESYRKSNEARVRIDAKMQEAEQKLESLLLKGRRKDDPLIDKL